MLILKLYPGQTIWIGKGIQVTVLGNLEGLVRIGVQTRQLEDIKVAEEEFWDKGQSHEPQ
jgi:sRNA-binding carbon storage regulator CsrA